MRVLANSISCLIALLILTISFQNCSFRASLQQSSSELSKVVPSLENSGNGGGYEGKPGGTYYRYVPNFSCAGTPGAEQITQINYGQAYLYQSSKSECAAEALPVLVSDFNISPFQMEFISVNDSLFKRYDSKPSGIPNSLAEILCRDDFDKPTFEIVSHYDREANAALTRVYSSQAVVPDFSVSRILSSTEVRYVSGDLSFKVDLSKPSTVGRRFLGEIEKSSLDRVSVQPLVCVIGGSIDNSKWRLRELTKIDAGPFRLLASGEVVFLSEVEKVFLGSTFFRAIQHLFQIGIDGLVADFSNSVLGDDFNVTLQVLPVNEYLLIMEATKGTFGQPSLYLYDKKRDLTTQLTNRESGVSEGQYFSGRPVLTQGEDLVFDLGIDEGSFSGSSRRVVRVFDVKESTFADVKILDESSGGYQVLSKTNKVVFFWLSKNSIRNVIEVYDIKSKLSVDLPLKIPEGCSVSGGFRSNEVAAVENETSIFGFEFCESSKGSLLQVSLLDGAVKTLGYEKRINGMSPGKKWLLLTDASNEHLAYGVETGRSLNIPIDPNFGYYTGPGSNADSKTNFMLSNSQAKIAFKNENYLYGFGGNTEDPAMYQVDLTTGLTHPICEKAVGKKMFVGALPDQRVFLFTYDFQHKIYRFYQVKGSAECQRINEFPSEYPNVIKLLPTDIGFGVLLGTPLSANTEVYHPEAVFVPIDGRPPLKLSANAKGNWEMEVSADKKRIVLRGPGSDGVVRIFSVDL